MEKKATAKKSASKKVAKKAGAKTAAAKTAAARKPPTKKAASARASSRSGAPEKAAARKPVAARARARARDRAAAPPIEAQSPAKRTALAVAEAALDKKALNVLIVDVRGKVDYADYLVVMSGTSDRHVSALARGIEEGVAATTGERCSGVEGLPEGAWVLMDFGDVVVHVFHDEVRGYYDLESLFLDAHRVPVPGQAPTPASNA